MQLPLQKTKPVQPVSTQEHLRIAEIRDGILILGNGELRQVVKVSSVNFALKSEDEQTAIVLNYQNFLNSLSFPLQIVIQSRRLDLAPYLAKLQERLNGEQNELVRLQIADYLDFIQKLLTVANIMDKHFFVVVGFSPPVTKKPGFITQLAGSKKRLQPKFTPDQFAAYKKELLQRTNVVVSGLSGLGVKSAVLNTQQLIELFYATYNPEEAIKQRLTYSELLSSPVIRAEGQVPPPAQSSGLPATGPTLGGSI